ncbi:MAG: protein-glutamate O-methyltransferase CheR [Anaerolineaceae bacterium]|nr:protein-glutamate O-methyltransferase CheR [Anaerolineaceae bacterium]
MDLGLYQKVKKQIQTILNINLDHYKDEQMRRRLDSWLSRVGADDWDAYFSQIQKDKVEWSRFRDFITINVTEFFRDFERWKQVREHILPDLLKENQSQSLGRFNEGLRVWSAGCSKGAEIYSISMILDDLNSHKKHYLLATDLDQGALEVARNGGPYVHEEIRNVSPVQRGMYFLPGGPPHKLNGTLGKKITFKEHDLLKSSYEKNFDLVICRNVVIYFTADTKAVLYKKFYDSLRPGGVLFVGGTEIIPRPQDIGFKSIGFSFYAKK